MASWMIHLRVADALLDKLADLDRTAFVVGSIAPDSGVPNSDWTTFTPPKSVTHYKTKTKDGASYINVEAFCREYFSPEQLERCDNTAYSFFLGYYTHLLTDVEWSEKIYRPTKKAAENTPDVTEKMKEDWYDLDFRFLHEHPDFRAFAIYERAAGFRNTFMKEFSEDAFDDRREYISAFYRGDEHGELYRDYPYLTPERADRFVEETVEKLCELLPKNRTEEHDA